MSASQAKMPFEDFAELLSKELSVPKEKLKPESSLVNDLQVDSLALASMMLRLEELGVSIPMERAWDIQTVGDAYRAYLEAQIP